MVCQDLEEDGSGGEMGFELLESLLCLCRPAEPGFAGREQMKWSAIELYPLMKRL